MRVLVTGADGMLGICVVKLLEENKIDVIPIDFKSKHKAINIDICDTDAVFNVVDKTKPDFIIHTAAQTNVDLCSKEVDKAYKINALGTGVLAAVAAENDIPIIYISTDYVFDGNKDCAYTEFDIPNPLNDYGKSKLAGENIVKELCNKFFIVRTSWLFAPHGKNFPLNILEATKTRKELNVVSDQIGSPTYAKDLAEFLLSLLDNKLYGIYHFTNSGSCSWYDFTNKILEFADIKDVKVNPICTAEWPTPAKRPKNSVLRRYKLELLGKDNVRHWEVALKEFIREWNIVKL